MDFLESAPDQAEGLHLDDAVWTMPKQVSPVLWANRLSPLYRCFRVYVNGEHRGVIGQASPSAPWQATRTSSPLGQDFPTRALALAYVAPDATAQARTKRAASTPKGKTMTAIQAEAVATGTILTARFKGETYTMEKVADGTFTITKTGGVTVATGVASPSLAGRVVTGRRDKGGMWTAPVADAAADEAEAAYQRTKAIQEAANAATLAEAEAGRKARNAAKNAARKARNDAKRAAKTAAA